jgi:hypothetical protein
METVLYDNGTAGGTWGIDPLELGFGEVLVERAEFPGHYYQTNSAFHLVRQYTWQQITTNCGSSCSDFYGSV